MVSICFYFTPISISTLNFVLFYPEAPQNPDFSPKPVSQMANFSHEIWDAALQRTTPGHAAKDQSDRKDDKDKGHGALYRFIHPDSDSDSSCSDDARSSIFSKCSLFIANSIHPERRKTSESKSVAGNEQKSIFALNDQKGIFALNDQKGIFALASDSDSEDHAPSRRPSIFKDLLKKKPTSLTSMADPDCRRESSKSSILPRTRSETSLAEKYGKLEEVIGKGSYGVVRLCCPVGGLCKYAVKEFRKKHKEESEKGYVKKLIAGNSLLMQSSASRPA